MVCTVNTPSESVNDLNLSCSPSTNFHHTTPQTRPLVSSLLNSSPHLHSASGRDLTKTRRSLLSSEVSPPFLYEPAGHIVLATDSSVCDHIICVMVALSRELEGKGGILEPWSKYFLILHLVFCNTGTPSPTVSDILSISKS